MELSVFPIRTVETNSPKQVSGGNDDHYTNNKSAASKADSGDKDTFSRHMRRGDENASGDEQKGAPEQDNLGEQKVKKPTDDQSAKMGGMVKTDDGAGESMSFVAVEVAMKNEVPLKKEMILAPLVKVPTMNAAINTGEGGNAVLTQKGKGAQSLLTIEPVLKTATNIPVPSITTGTAVETADALKPLVGQ